MPNPKNIELTEHSVCTSLLILVYMHHKYIIPIAILAPWLTPEKFQASRDAVSLLSEPSSMSTRMDSASQATNSTERHQEAAHFRDPNSITDFVCSHLHTNDFL